MDCNIHNGFNMIGIPLEIEDRELCAVGSGVAPLGPSISSIHFNGGRKITRLVEVFNGGREGEDRRGGGLNWHEPPHGQTSLPKDEEGDEDEG